MQCTPSKLESVVHVHRVGESHHRESFSTMKNESTTGDRNLWMYLANGSVISGEQEVFQPVESIFTCDPLIGMEISFPADFQLGHEYVPVAKGVRVKIPARRTRSRDTPLSLSASGRNISQRRRHSLLNISSLVNDVASTESENSREDGRIQPRAKRASLPDMTNFSCHDRFAASLPSKNGKVDQLMPTPVKRKENGNRDFFFPLSSPGTSLRIVN